MAKPRLQLPEKAKSALASQGCIAEPLAIQSYDEAKEWRVVTDDGYKWRIGYDGRVLNPKSKPKPAAAPEKAEASAKTKPEELEPQKAAAA